MARNEFENREKASEAGKKSSRLGTLNKSTELKRYLLEKTNAARKGSKPITMNDLKKDSPEVWLWLRENATTWEQVLLCESHLSKYLHSTNIEHTGKDGKDLINKIEIEIVTKKD